MSANRAWPLNRPLNSPSALVSPQRRPQNSPQSIGHDALFAALQSEDRNKHAAVAGAADPADLDGGIRVHQLLGHAGAGYLDTLFVPCQQQMWHLVGDGRHDAFTSQSWNVLQRRFDNA